MPFDSKVWHSLAKQGDVAGIAIYTSLAIRNLVMAVETIKSGGDPSEFTKEALEMADELSKVYRDMSGYTPDGE